MWALTFIFEKVKLSVAFDRCKNKFVFEKLINGQLFLPKIGYKKICYIKIFDFVTFSSTVEQFSVFAMSRIFVSRFINSVQL